MNPKKFKDLLEPASEKSGESIEDIRNIWGSYWDELRETLPNLPDLTTRVVGLGAFTVKTWLIDKQILANKARIEVYKQDYPHQHQNLANLCRIKNRMDLEKPVKITKKQKRRDANIKNNSNSLEE